MSIRKLRVKRSVLVTLLVFCLFMLLVAGVAYHESLETVAIAIAGLSLVLVVGTISNYHFREKDWWAEDRWKALIMLSVLIAVMGLVGIFYSYQAKGYLVLTEECIRLGVYCIGMLLLGESIKQLAHSSQTHINKKACKFFKLLAIFMVGVPILVFFCAAISMVAFGDARLVNCFSGNANRVLIVPSLFVSFSLGMTGPVMTIVTLTDWKLKEASN